MSEEEQQQQLQKLALDVLTLSRNSLMVNLRFMDSAISRLRPVPKGTETTATDGQTYYYSPVHLLRSYRTARELPARRYLHTVFHCIFRHMFIGTLKDEVLWDLACDMAVEHAINGLSLDAVTIDRVQEQEQELKRMSRNVKYLTAEMICHYFLENRPNESDIRRLRRLFSLDDHVFWYKPPEGLPGASGGGEADSKESGEEAQKENLFAQRRQTEAMWKEISEYIQTALETLERKKGDRAGGLTQNLKAVNRERYDYTSFLKQFSVMGEAMKINPDEFDYIYYTYGLELYRNMPLIEPLEYKDVRRIREFVIAIDTSGSVEGKLVQSFIQKTYNILKSSESFFSRINLHIIQCDAEIQEDVKITSQEEFDSYLQTMQLHGFGGTDFRPVFRYVDQLIAEKEFANLKGLIYFTDGFGTFPERQPPYRTAFVYVSDEYENPEVPVWAIKLVLESEDLK